MSSMPSRFRRSPHRPLAVLFFLAFAWVPAAQAQMTVSVTNISNRDTERQNLQTSGINAADCADSPSVRLLIRNIPTSATVLDFWRGGKDTDCASTDNRTAQGGDRICDHIAITGTDLTIAGAEETLEFALTDLVDCDQGNGTYSIHVLAADS
ncbi:MAG: hypothetical protein KC416_07870, partial [Myxococcales bacterium]|nr:hypothetical protein [Myxococcales bacterium]